MAGKAAGFDLTWRGVGENESGVDRVSGRTLIRVNPRFFRPLEIHQRVGNPEKAFIKLRWWPTTTLAQLCEVMVKADMAALETSNKVADLQTMSPQIVPLVLDCISTSTPTAELGVMRRLLIEVTRFQGLAWRLKNRLRTSWARRHD